MPASICMSDISLLQKKAQRDALGIEILIREIAKSFIGNVCAIVIYYYALRLQRRLKKYLTTFDLNNCAKCHGFDECAKAFYETDKEMLNNIQEIIPNLEEILLETKKPRLLVKSMSIFQNSIDKIEDRVEDLGFILVTKDGILDEIANALTEASPKLKNWREGLPFLQ